MGAKNKQAAILTGVLLLWLAAIAGGLKILGDYANTPGTVGPSSNFWPAKSALIRPTDHRSTLLLFLHPKCPCSRATLSSLDSLMAKTHGKAHVYAIFIQPQGWSDAETKSSLWKQAASIPGVTTLLDPQGKEAELFGAMTSGYLLAFDGAGHLAFRGGITDSRGHMGDNAGLEAVTLLVNSGHAPIAETKIFGCSLFKAHGKFNGVQTVGMRADGNAR